MAESGAAENVAAAATDTAEPEPEKPALYKYKPKLHMQDRDGKPSTGQPRNFEFQEELFPELGAEAPKSTADDLSTAGRGGGNRMGGGDSMGSGRPRLKLAPRSIPS